MPPSLGVLVLTTEDGQVVDVDFAGGRSPFGLRGLVAAKAEAEVDRELWFEYEETSQYTSRALELRVLLRLGPQPSEDALVTE